MLQLGPKSREVAVNDGDVALLVRLVARDHVKTVLPCRSLVGAVELDDSLPRRRAQVELAWVKVPGGPADVRKRKRHRPVLYWMAGRVELFKGNAWPVAAITWLRRTPSRPPRARRDFAYVVLRERDSE